MLSQSPSSCLDSDDLPGDWGMVDGSLFEVFGEHLLVRSPGSAEDEVSVVDLNMSETEDEEFERYLTEGHKPERHTSVTCRSTDDKLCSKSENPSKLECTKFENSPKFVFENSSHVKKAQIQESTQMTSEKLCMNKSAIAARENRQKKKQYVTQMENKMKVLAEENAELKRGNLQKEHTISGMKNEISYLRSVIANQTGLTALLRNINQTSGLSFNTSLGYETKEMCSKQIKRKLDSSENEENVDILQDNTNIIHDRCAKKCKVDQDPTKVNVLVEKLDLSKPEVKESGISGGLLTPCSSPEPVTSGGVCLHVSSNKVSLEFCSTCATSAAEAWKVSGDHTYGKMYAGSV